MSKTIVKILNHTIDISNIKSISKVSEPTIDWSRFDDSGGTYYHPYETEYNFNISLHLDDDIIVYLKSKQDYEDLMQSKFRKEIDYLKYLRDELFKLWENNKSNFIEIK